MANATLNPQRYQRNMTPTLVLYRPNKDVRTCNVVPTHIRHTACLTLDTKSDRPDLVTALRPSQHRVRVFETICHLTIFRILGRTMLCMGLSSASSMEVA